MLVFRLLQCCSWGLPCSGILHSVTRSMVSYVLRQHTGLVWDNILVLSTRVEHPVLPWKFNTLRSASDGAWYHKTENTNTDAIRRSSCLSSTCIHQTYDMTEVETKMMKVKVMLLLCLSATPWRQGGNGGTIPCLRNLKTRRRESGQLHTLLNLTPSKTTTNITNNDNGQYADPAWELLWW